MLAQRIAPSVRRAAKGVRNRDLWFRVRVRHDSPLDLAGCGTRERFRDVNPLRTFVVGKALATVGQELGLGNGGPNDHGGRDLFAKHRIRRAETDRLRDRGVREQYLVDLSRRDFLAASVDLLLESTD